MNDYRKITVGVNLKEAFVYTVGQEVLNGKFKIHSFNITGERVIVYIIRGEEISEWMNYPLGICSFQESIDL